MSSDQLDLRDPRWNDHQHSLRDYEDSDAVTMDDYLDDDADSEPPEPETSTTKSFPHDRKKNRHGTPQRCRWCGDEFETAGRSNYFLNVHEANCEAKNDE